MSTTPEQTPPYKIVSHREDTWYDPRLDTVASGWEFHIEWVSTGALFTVRVPGDPPSAEKVDKAIRDAGAEVAQFGELGA